MTKFECDTIISSINDLSLVLTSDISIIGHTHPQVPLHGLLAWEVQSSIDHEVLTALAYVVVLMFLSLVKTRLY